MSAEPTNAEYERFFELSQGEVDLTAAELTELMRLESLVSPWLYTVKVYELGLEGHGLIAVPETFDCGFVHTHWISSRFAVIPEHRQREIDGDTRFTWAILPFDEQPTYACSLIFEAGRFRRDSPEKLMWPFDVWVFESIQARRAYVRHFGSEFPDSHGSCEDAIEKWIEKLNY